MSVNQPCQFKFFLPHARLMSDAAIATMRENGDLPATDLAGSDGLWIEMDCPDGSCLDENGRITLPVTEADDARRGVFLNLFCPEDNCEIVQSTDIP